VEEKDMMKYSASYFGLMALAVGAIVTPAAAQNVVLYSANDDTVNQIVAAGFKKATGTTVNVVSTGSGVLFRRIASEKDNPQADVVWGVSTALLKRNEEYFQPYEVKGREAVPAEYRSAANLWISTNLQIVTINQNTKSIEAAAGPKSWQDLLDPKWKGKIAFTDPANSGFSYAAATSLLARWGDDDAAWKKLSTLIGNAKILNRSTLVFDGNGSGEYPIGISLEYAGYLWAHNGAPVQVTYPSDGTVALAEGAAVIKGAPGKDAAKALIDYLASKPVQEELLKATFRRPARQDVDLSVAGSMPALSAIKILPYDDAKWNDSRSDTLAKIKTVIQNSR
jgi:iron(III) transport system substrate-binding protein